MTRPTRLALFATIVLPIQLPGCDAVVLRGAEPAPARVSLPALRPATGSATDPFARPGTKAVVVAVLSFKCPLARDYVEPLSAVAAAYGPKGGTVVGVVPNETPPTAGLPSDLVLTVGDDFHLAARGPDHYRCFVLPTGLTEDKLLVGYEVRPGDASVVHHVLNYFDTTGTARRLEREARGKGAGIDRGPGYESPMGIGFTPKDKAVGGFGGWAPGIGAQRAPAGTGHLLPKGSDPAPGGSLREDEQAHDGGPHPTPRPATGPLVPHDRVSDHPDEGRTDTTCGPGEYL